MLFERLCSAMTVTKVWKVSSIDTEYPSVFSPNAENNGFEKLQIRTFFRHLLSKTMISDFIYFTKILKKKLTWTNWMNINNPNFHYTVLLYLNHNNVSYRASFYCLLLAIEEGSCLPKREKFSISSMLDTKWW